MIATLFAFIGKKGYVFFFLPESNVSVEEADLILSSFFFYNNAQTYGQMVEDYDKIYKANIRCVSLLSAVQRT